MDAQAALVAVGIKMANCDLCLIVVGVDGDAYMMKVATTGCMPCAGPAKT